MPIDEAIKELLNLKNDLTRGEVEITGLWVDYRYWPMRKDGKPFASRYSPVKNLGYIRAEAEHERNPIRPNREIKGA